MIIHLFSVESFQRKKPTAKVFILRNVQWIVMNDIAAPIVDRFTVTWMHRYIYVYCTCIFTRFKTRIQISMNKDVQTRDLKFHADALSDSRSANPSSLTPVYQTPATAYSAALTHSSLTPANLTGNIMTWRHEDMETRRFGKHRDMERWRHGNWSHGDMETWRQRDKGTRKH
jgi:hypothetical protein